ncbi:GNAT family N-acetyltransferase [Flavobacterium sp.]|uniref:GNAT family N-acetyltransferase n=1 Tax=Flavobacterium sp. TaxID=239 RepID=UPI002A7FE2C5|nr:GNAT family N-acetyltransferase [Flavobacterium sp.]
MGNYKVQRYQSSQYNDWNTFVANAKNATFLFHRDFMEYHENSFDDFSLMIFDEKEKLVAVLPAHKLGKTLYSHQGLTYGGLVLSSKIILSEVVLIVKNILEFLHKNTISRVELKIIPSIYNTFPSDEMEYICFLLDAKLDRRDALAVLDITNQISVSRVRKRGIEKGKVNSLVVKEENDFTSFWNVLLIPNLKERYNAKPIHSLAEITYLKSKFPKQIKQYNVYQNDKIVGGVTVFETNNVIHPQYISGNKAFNNELGGLDFLYHHLISSVYKNEKYFDFGISNENQGRQVNESLHYWKESFGARTIVQNFYSIETDSFSKLDNVLI